MKSKKEIEQKLSSDPGVIALKKIMEEEGFCDSFSLTGGAVIDILDNRKPKDYDVISSYNDYCQISERLGHRTDVELMYTSETAISLKIQQKYILQILRTNITEFNFEIEKSRFMIKSGELRAFDYLGYRSKKLVINNGVCKKVPKYRIKHWAKKGYTLDPMTLKSHNFKVDKASKTFWSKIRKKVRKTIKQS